MDTSLRACFSGTKFTIDYPMGKTALKALLKGVPALKAQWKVQKNTGCLVTGDDADPAVVTAAREAGLPILDFATWVGLTLGAEATTVRAYLDALLGAGLQLQESSNEGDGAFAAHTIPMVPVATQRFLSATHLSVLQGMGSTANIDAVNTLVGWVAEHHRAFLTPHSASTGGRAPSSHLNPANDAAEFYVKPHALRGARGMGAVQAIGDGRVIPTEVLQYRLGKVSHGSWAQLCQHFADQPVEDNVKSLVVVGGVEQGEQSISFVAIPVVHT